MSFEIEHEKWIKWHLSRRNGERKDALKRGHGYGNRLFAEKTWWPLVGHLDEMKENSGFIQAVLRNTWGPYFTSGKPILQPFEKIERMLIRYAVCHNRIIRPAEAAIELDLHKQTVIKYCRELARKGKLRPVPTGSTGKVYSYELLGSMLSFEVMG